MTREEAIAKVRLTHFHLYGGTPESIVDLFSDLGMLKLDEPKSERERIRDALKLYGSVSLSNLLDPDIFYATANSAGLRVIDASRYTIVEKQHGE